MTQDKPTKTAMMELIEWLDSFGFPKEHESTRAIIRFKATQLKEEEKTQIVKAFEAGDNLVYTDVMAEDYFTQTYKQ